MPDEPPRLTSTPPASDPGGAGAADPAGDHRELIEVRLEVLARHHGWRLDHFIKDRIRRLSRTRIQHMIRSQERLGGARLRPSSRVRQGEELVLLRPAPDEPDVPRSYRVLHDDGQIGAIDKPAGLPVHATARFHRNTLMAMLRESWPAERPPSLAHRLDRETSGIVLLGLTRAASAALKQLFRERLVEKRYLALVHGDPGDEGRIELPLGPDRDSGIRVKMAVDPAAGLPARTRYRTVERRGGVALVLAEPETGRQHQIRAHLAAIGHPLVGDKLYGQGPDGWLEYLETGWTDRLARRLLLPRHALHAHQLSLTHPFTGQKLRLTCELPADLQQFWDRAGQGQGPVAGQPR